MVDGMHFYEHVMKFWMMLLTSYSNRYVPKMSSADVYCSSHHK